MKNLYFLFLPILLMTSCTQPPEKEKPNIILLFCDDLGYGDLGSYGHPTIRTPHLDRLAADGTKFTSFYSGSPACTASRYALLTGRYPIRSGFSWVLNPGSSRGIHPRETTLAEGLKGQGYATACYGKWHLGTAKPEYSPLANGFDEYLGLPYSNDMIPPKHPDIALLDGRDTVELNPDQRKLTRAYTERAISFLEKNQGEPFFIYLPYAMPHVPLHPGEAFAGKSERGIYGDVVEEIDWSVGAIRQAVEEAGLAENTLIFFTSDNGPWIVKNAKGGSSGLLRDGKGSTWEGGMRVPAIAFWEGEISPSTVSTQPLGAIDVYRTCLDLAGGQTNEEQLVDGQSFTPLLLGNGAALPSRPLFYYGVNNALMAVRKGNWKLHVRTHSQTGNRYFEKEPPLLFDLGTDPSEQYELSEQHPEIVAELLAEIEQQKEKIKLQPNYFEIDQEQSLRKHLAYGKSVSLATPPSEKYGTAEALTDGILQDPDDYVHLPGWQGGSLEAVIDLGRPTTVSKVETGFIQSQDNWIFLPEKVSFFISGDGESFREIGTVTTEEPVKGHGSRMVYFSPKIGIGHLQGVRYLKVIARNRGDCPDWHSGAGHPCWIFANEIVVE